MCTSGTGFEDAQAKRQSSNSVKTGMRRKHISPTHASPAPSCAQVTSLNELTFSLPRNIVSEQGAPKCE